MGHEHISIANISKLWSCSLLFISTYGNYFHPFSICSIANCEIYPGGMWKRLETTMKTCDFFEDCQGTGGIWTAIIVQNLLTPPRAWDASGPDNAGEPGTTTNWI
jgi:hypothetical protein